MPRTFTPAASETLAEVAYALRRAGAARGRRRSDMDGGKSGEGGGGECELELTAFGFGRFLVGWWLRNCSRTERLHQSMALQPSRSITK